MAWAAQELATHFRYILGKLNDQRQHEHFTDITLIVSGQQFRAHRAVLAASSNFFHTFFQDFHNEPLVEIEGVSVDAFRQLLEFTYTASFAVEGSNPASLGSVLKAAKYLQMEEAIRTLVARQKIMRQTSGKKKTGEHRKIFDARSVVTEPLPELHDPEGAKKPRQPSAPKQANAPKQAADAGGEGASALALLADITSKYEQEQAGGDSQCPAMELDLTQDGLEGALVERGGVEVEVSSTSEAPPPPVIPERLFCCKYCSRSFRMYYHFREHLHTHASPKFNCKECGKKYTRERAWKMHMECHHKPDEDEASGDGSGTNSNLVHTCIYCNKAFRHQGHYKEHLRKHTGERPFDCPNCPKQFGRKGTLKAHLQACCSAFGAKKGRRKVYECQICTQSFQHWEKFKEHLMEHMGDRPNHCLTCDQWFTRPDELQQHMNEQHGLGPVATEVHTLNIVTVDMTDAQAGADAAAAPEAEAERQPESPAQRADAPGARAPQPRYIRVRQTGEAAAALAQLVSMQQEDEAQAQYVGVQHEEEEAQYASAQQGDDAPAQAQYASVEHGEEAATEQAQYVSVQQHGDETPAHGQYMSVQHEEHEPAHAQYVSVEHGEEAAAEHAQYVNVQHEEHAHAQYVTVEHGEEAPAVDAQHADAHAPDAQDAQETLYVAASVGAYAPEASAAETHHLDMQQVYTHVNIGLSESQQMDMQQVDASAQDTHVYILIPNAQHMAGTQYVEIPSSETRYVQIPSSDAHYVQIPSMGTQYVEIPTTHAQYVEETQALSGQLSDPRAGLPHLAAFQADTEGNIAAFAIATHQDAAQGASCASCSAAPEHQIQNGQE